MQRFGLDVETCSKEFEIGSLRTVQIYNPQKDKTSVFFFPQGNFNSGLFYKVDHSDDTVYTINRFVTSYEVSSLLSNSEHEFVTHAGLYDQFIILRDLGVTPKIAADSFVLASLIPSSIRVSRSLDNQMKIYVDPDYNKGLYGSWDDFDWSVNTLSDNAVLYAARDARAAHQLEPAQRLQHEKRANEIYDLELQLIPVLARMRLAGIRVDEREFINATVEHQAKLKEMEAELSEVRGSPVRVASRKDLQEWLYDERGNDCPMKTKSGQRSVAEAVLEKLTDPIVEKIQKTKHCQSVSSSLNKLLETGPHQKEKGFWLFFPEFKPLSESYGSRIYSQNPSVNQFPWALRETVKPEKGLFYFADVSAFEFILLAFAAGEEDILRVYEQGGDIHRRIASKVLIAWNLRLLMNYERKPKQFVMRLSTERPATLLPEF